MLQDAPDEKLIALFVEGNTRAFDVLVSRHQVRLYNFIRYRTGDPELANDLLQEVFLRVVRRASSFGGRARFKTWLYTIARNLCTDQGRKAQHRRIVVLDPAMNGGEQRPQSHVLRTPDGGPGPDRLAASRRVQHKIQEAILALPEEQREVFLLKERDGLTFKEIGEVQGVAANTVKSRMRYALTALRERLKPYHDPQD